MVIHLFKKSFLDFFYLLFLDFKVLICKCSSRAYRGVRLVKWYFFFPGRCGGEAPAGRGVRADVPWMQVRGGAPPLIIFFI